MDGWMGESMRLVSSWHRKISALAAAVLAVAGGAFALLYSPQPATNSTIPATEKGLASSQNIEQQLMDQISQAQKEVQAALAARTAAIYRYANATGSATLLVQSKKLGTPRTQGKTGASGGKKENEFERD